MSAARTSPPLTRDHLAFALVAIALVVVLWALRGVAILVAFAFLLAYVLDPLVSALERVPLPRRQHLSRPIGAFLVIAVLVALIGWLAVIAIPLLASEIAGFFERVPGLIESLLNYVRAQAAGTTWSAELDRAIEAMRLQVTASLPQLAGGALKLVGGLFTQVDQVLGLAVLPVLAFYLLAERERVRDSMFRFLPERIRDPLRSVGPSVHRALQSYVRGQALVCLTMGVATGAMLGIAGVPNAFLLGVLAGFGEILPLIGALITIIAIALSGLSLDLWHGVIGVALYILNNWLLGTFITPRVMERYLEMHPFAVIVSVLAGAQLLGPAGAILALPAAAVLQAVVEDLGPRSRDRQD